MAHKLKKSKYRITNIELLVLPELSSNYFWRVWGSSHGTKGYFYWIELVHGKVFRKTVDGKIIIGLSKSQALSCLRIQASKMKDRISEKKSYYEYNFIENAHESIRQRIL